MNLLFEKFVYVSITDRVILKENWAPLMLDSEEDKEDNEDDGQDDEDDHHCPTVNHATQQLYPNADNMSSFYIFDFHFPCVY